MLGNKERSDGSLATDRKAAVSPLVFAAEYLFDALIVATKTLERRY
jgi:hypothetical protein